MHGDVKNKMNFITGEKLQEFAHVTVALNTENNYNSELVQTQIRNTKTRCFVFSPYKTDVVIPSELRTAKIVFTYPHILDYFFNYVFPQIDGPITLITHNSDVGVDSRYIPFLNSNKINRWFCQNKSTIHSKLSSLPIGIANRQWPHGNIQNIEEIIKLNLPKNNLALKTFDLSTNTQHRQQINIQTEQNGFVMSPPMPHIEYLKQLKQSYFCFSPFGGGADCHRIWECLYLGCVPIVPKHEYVFRDFEELPILFVDNFATITKDYLKSRIPEFFPFDNFNLNKLDLNYWKKEICGHII